MFVKGIKYWNKGGQKPKIILETKAAALRASLLLLILQQFTHCDISSFCFHAIQSHHLQFYE